MKVDDPGIPLKDLVLRHGNCSLSARVVKGVPTKRSNGLRNVCAMVPVKLPGD
jgi:hypothetical protein